MCYFLSYLSAKNIPIKISIVATIVIIETSAVIKIAETINETTGKRYKKLFVLTIPIALIEIFQSHKHSAEATTPKYNTDNQTSDAESKISISVASIVSNATGKIVIRE